MAPSKSGKIQTLITAVDWLENFYNFDFQFKICFHKTGILEKDFGIHWLILIGSQGHMTFMQLLVAITDT